MQFTPLTEQTQNLFRQHVERDYSDFYFFIYDWLNHKNKTQIYLAQSNGSVEGSMVVFEGTIAQLRGSVEAVDFLLGKLSASVREVQVPLECEHLLAEWFSFFS